jgi:ribosomal protein S18 acetylase RimI-like enzyme
MDVVPVRSEHVDQLLAIYLAQVASAPHCCLVPGRARFRSDLLGLGTQAPRLHPAPQQAQVFVAEESGAARGFAALATYHDWDDDERQAITGLFFAHEAAGHALIRACEARATSDELDAFPNSHGNTLIQAYNAGWDGLSDRIPGVAQVLAQHGYVPHERELHLAKQLPHVQCAPPLLPPAMTMRVPEAPAGYREALLVQVLDGESVVGACSYSTLALLTGEPAASRTGYVDWLHVNEGYRRRGIARALMAAAMDGLAAQGCEACWLTTAADNWAAQSLYLTLGFSVVDCSVSFRKTLGS